MNEQSQASEQLLTISEACAALRVSRGFIYTLQKRGALELLKLGRAARIRRSTIEHLMRTGASK